MSKKEIAAPFWIHLTGAVIWIVLVILVNIINAIFYTGFHIGLGILILFGVLYYSNAEYKRAVENKKNPVCAYFLHEVGVFFGLVIFGAIYYYFGFWIALLTFIGTISLIFITPLICKKKSKK